MKSLRRAREGRERDLNHRRKILTKLLVRKPSERRR